VRLVLYSWHVNFEPFEVLPYSISLLFQIINILSIFFSMVVILTIFTRDKMATEAKLSEYNKKLKQISEIDPLTKLPNRRSVISGTISNIMRGVCENGICIAIGDIDFFKNVNDTYGHEAGDEVLKQLAVLCQEFMKDHGIAARWGGEEFLFVFNNENLDEAGVAANALLSKIRNLTVKWNDIEIKVTMTIGVADVNTFLSGSVTEAEIDDRINEAVGAADKKLYMGKSGGRNKVVV
jgi:diguanylate cyclase (GGDEF)-like protein